MDKSSTFVVGIAVALVMTLTLYWLSKRMSRSFRFSKRDLKAGRLNRKEGRQLLSRLRKKGKKKRLRF